MPTILLFEDDETYLYALTKLLEQAGFRVVAAHEFTRALDTLDREKVDLLLTDIKMPLGQPHGFALARMARQRRRDLPVIYLSGLVDVPELERETALGTILVKPIDPDRLVAE